MLYEVITGTHFFQNLTSLRVGYFTVNTLTGQGHWDENYLQKQMIIYQDEWISHRITSYNVCYTKLLRTANAFPEDKERCMASGMDDYISKPFQPEDLISKIKKHLS